MTPPSPAASGPGSHIGPQPFVLKVAKPYVFEQEIQASLAAIGANEAKENNNRMQGVTWIHNIRKALQLPVTTYFTAVVYYHNFRLVHPENEYDYRDAAAAALFSACKIEDTLKKSRDILCAAWNSKLPVAEHLSPDDPVFEEHGKRILGLERLMLEASGFNFRIRHPHEMLVKLAKSSKLDNVTGPLSFNILLDLYRTFAPLKQTRVTMAIACLELAVRLNNGDLAQVSDGAPNFVYKDWRITRAEVMETLLDLLDLYTHHRTASMVGPDFSLDTFITVRIAVNHEATSKSLPRYTQWVDNATTKSDANAVQKPSAVAKAVDGITSTSMSPESPSGHVSREKSKDRTLRFVMDLKQARNEKAILEAFLGTEEVEEQPSEDGKQPSEEAGQPIEEGVEPRDGSPWDPETDVVLMNK